MLLRGFDKIFNYGENKTGDNWCDTDQVFVTRKVNGFCGFLTNVNGKLIISTTGSLDSVFIEYARDYLNDITPGMCKHGVTYLFEICHPTDPHIIPENYGAYFLGAVEHSTGLHYYKFDSIYSDLISSAIENFAALGIHTDDEPELWSFGDLKKHVHTVKHEGYVIVNARLGETLKIKSPYYLFNKFLARVGTSKLITRINSGNIFQTIDEEYYSLVNKIKANGVEKFAALDEQARLKYLRNWAEM